MTPAQKANRERFKKVVAEAKKLRKKNPKLTQAQAVKQAWAITYSKGTKVGAAKKAAPKKAAKKAAPKKMAKHIDTKSHNVNIRVVSGIKGLKKISGVDPHKAKYFIEYSKNGIKTIEYFDKLPTGLYYAAGYQNPKDKGKAFVTKFTDSGTSLVPLKYTKNNLQVKK